MRTQTAGNTTSRVCALPIVGDISPETLEAAIDNVLNFRSYRLLRIFAHEEVVGVKPCQNRAEHSLDYVSSVVSMLRHRGVTPMVCDTTDRYRNMKRNAIKRMEELAAHFANPTIPIVILDGIKGEHELVVRGGGGMPDAYLAGELPSLGGAVVVSCARADLLSGMSGALVNMGVGFSSRKGKIKHYAMQVPHVHHEKCYSCRRCLRECPVGAIEMAETHVVINVERCINCGHCIEVARFGGITYAWDATPEYFSSVVTAHASAALEVLNHRVVCMNVITLPPTDNGQPQLTILFSRDPVAVDAATVQILSQHGLLREKDRMLASQLLAKAESAGVGRMGYFVERVAF
jgi:uncharacterized Fe-S center protein